MKTKIILGFCFLVSIFFSCKEELIAPTFDVKVLEKEYHVGDSVSFVFSGNAENITFYSGEEGNNYENRNRTTIKDGTLEFDFKSWVDRGAGDPVAGLLVSTNFAGKVDTNTIKAATWVDITSRAVFSAGVDQTPSGTIDLAEFSNTGKPVTVAFRYISSVIKSPSSRLVIRSINFNKKSPTGVIIPLSQLNTTTWGAVSFKNPLAVWSITSAQLLMTGGTTALDEDWVVAKSFDVNATKPDFGLVVKNITTDAGVYNYAYAKPGSYKVIFVVSNRINSNVKEVIKEVTVTIK